MNTEELLSALHDILDISAEVRDAIKEQPYGAIERRELLEFQGKQYWLVWDYIIYNEITLEEVDTGKQIKMWTGFSDKKCEEEYNKILSRLSDR